MGATPDPPRATLRGLHLPFKGGMERLLFSPPIMTDYPLLLRSASSTVRTNPDCCKQGYHALLRADDISSLIGVIIKYWADLHGTLWPQFHTLLQYNYAEWRVSANHQHLFYNQSASYGYCVIDADCPEGVELSGTVNAYVHGNAHVVIRGGADVVLSDHSTADAYGMSKVTLRDHAHANVYDHTTLRASGQSSAYSDGMTTIHAYGSSIIRIHRAFRIDQAESSSVIAAHSDQ